MGKRTALVVGCGSIGQRHIRLLGERDDVAIWACDLDQENLVGAFAGLKLHFYRHWDIAAEMRLLNQTSVTLQVLYDF